MLATLDVNVDVNRVDVDGNNVDVNTNNVDVDIFVDVGIIQISGQWRHRADSLRRY